MKVYEAKMMTHIGEDTGYELSEEIYDVPVQDVTQIGGGMFKWDVENAFYTRAETTPAFEEVKLILEKPESIEEIMISEQKHMKKMNPAERRLTKEVTVFFFLYLE